MAIGTALLAAGSIGAGLLGGKSKTKVKDLRTAEQRQRDAYAASLLNSQTPDIPELQIEGMSDAEKLAQEILGQYGTTEAEGLDTLRGISGASTNVLEDPAIAALMDTINKRGNETANRVSRSLMLRGATGGAGRDALGRTVTETQKEMLSTLAGYTESAKNRQLSATQLLNQLGENSTLNRLNALTTTGSLPRTLKQLQNQASYQKLLQEVLFPYNEKLRAAGAIGNAENLVTQTPSTLSQIAPLLGQLAVAGINSGGSKSGSNSTYDWQKQAEAGRTYGY